MQENQYNRGVVRDDMDSQVAANPGLLSTIGQVGPFLPGQGLSNMPSAEMIWKIQESQKPKAPKYAYHDGQYYLETPKGPVPIGERYIKPPSSTVKVDVNTGSDGKVIKVDDKKGTAIIRDDTAPNGLRVVKLPGGETDEQSKTMARTGGTAAAIAVRELDTLLDGLGANVESGKIEKEGIGGGPKGRMLANHSVGRFMVAGTPLGDFMGTLQSVKDTIAINRLLEIKASGAGLGQVPQSQLEALARALGNLDPSASDELLAKNLADVRRIYNDVVSQSIKDANDPTFQGTMESVARRGEQTQPSPNVTPPTVKRMVFNPATGRLE